MQLQGKGHNQRISAQYVGCLVPAGHLCNDTQEEPKTRVLSLEEEGRTGALDMGAYFQLMWKRHEPTREARQRDTKLPKSIDSPEGRVVPGLRFFRIHNEAEVLEH